MRPICLLAAAFTGGLLFLGASRAHAEERPIEVLTLEQALQLAATQNFDIHKAREYGNQVQGKYVEERAAAIPQVTATANWLRQRDASQEATGVPAPPYSVGTVDLGLKQALFTWGQVGAAIRAAQIGLLTSTDELRAARQGATRDVSTAFYDVLLAKELNGVARQTLDQRTRHLDEARKRYAAGVATDYDVLAAEVEVKNAQPDILRTENAVRLTRDRLRYLLAVKDREVDVQGSLDVKVSEAPGYEEALDTAKRRRPELSNLHHQIGVQDEVVTIEQAGDKPRLDFRANFGRRYLDVGVADAWGYEWSAGVFATWNLFDGFRTKGRVAQARSQAESMRIDERKLVDAVALDVRDAGNNLKLAEETLRALEGTLAQAERLLFMAEKGFEYGVKTKLDVDDAQLNVSQARVNLAQARRNYLVARVTLRWAMGVLGEES